MSDINWEAVNSVLQDMLNDVYDIYTAYDCLQDAGLSDSQASQEILDAITNSLDEYDQTGEVGVLIV